MSKLKASSSRSRPPKPLKLGANPRKVLKNHKERGPVRYYYTIDDVAALLDTSRSTVNRSISKGLDLTSLEEVVKLALFKRVSCDPDRTSSSSDPVEHKPFVYSWFDVANAIGVTLKQAVMNDIRTDSLESICDAREKRRWEQVESRTDVPLTEDEKYQEIISSIHQYLLSYKPEYAFSLERTWELSSVLEGLTYRLLDGSLGVEEFKIFARSTLPAKQNAAPVEDKPFDDLTEPRPKFPIKEPARSATICSEEQLCEKCLHSYDVQLSAMQHRATLVCRTCLGSGVAGSDWKPGKHGPFCQGICGCAHISPCPFCTIRKPKPAKQFNLQETVRKMNEDNIAFSKECLERGFDPNVIRHSVESCRKQQLSPKVGGEPTTPYFTHDVKPGSTSRVEPEERKPSLAERRAALKFREPSAEERLDALASNLNDVAEGFNKPEPCCAYAMGMEGGSMCNACRPR